MFLCVAGAVCFGVDPISSLLRRATSTYGVSVTRPFTRGRDPQRKLLRRDRADWCTDALDVLVHAGQQICLGQTIVRQYAPAAVTTPGRRAGSPPPPESAGPSKAVLDVYRADSPTVRYSTDPGVTRCGGLVLDIDQGPDLEHPGTSVVELTVSFGSHELRLHAVDTASGRSARTTIDFACQ